MDIISTLAGEALASVEPTSKYEQYHDDPVGFALDVLGVKNIPRWQRRLLKAAGKWRRFSVRSGHKIGKSACCVWLALWWVATRPTGRVVITAPTHHQIKDILWHELGLWYPKVRQLLGGEPMGRDPGTGIRLSGGRHILGVSTDQPEALAGISGQDLFMIVDEASGFEDALQEAILGNAAGGARILATGNMTRIEGWFYRSHFDGTGLVDLEGDPSDRPLRWRIYHVSSEEVAADPESQGIPGLAQADWVEQMRTDYGGHEPDIYGVPAYFDNSTYRVRVRGEPPIEVENAVIPEWNRVSDKVVKEWPRPAFLIPYAVSDWGYTDLTACLWGYYDFHAAMYVIEDEMVFERQHSGVIAPALNTRETELYKVTPRRYADMPEQMRADLAASHGYATQPVIKHGSEVTGIRPKKAAVNQLRTVISQLRLVVHPRCKHLQNHLRFGVWNTAGTAFDRHSEYGHFDALDALVYFVSAVNTSEDPNPVMVGITPDGWHVPPGYGQSSEHAELRKLVKRR